MQIGVQAKEDTEDRPRANHCGWTFSFAWTAMSDATAKQRHRQPEPDQNRAKLQLPGGRIGGFIQHLGLPYQCTALAHDHHASLQVSGTFSWHRRRGESALLRKRTRAKNSRGLALGSAPTGPPLSGHRTRQRTPRPLGGLARWLVPEELATVGVRS